MAYLGATQELRGDVNCHEAVGKQSLEDFFVSTNQICLSLVKYKLLYCAFLTLVSEYGIV